MAPTDVVRHDLQLSGEHYAIEKSTPIPLPLVPEWLRLPAVKDDHDPPVTTLVADLDAHPFSSIGKVYMLYNNVELVDGSGWVVTAKAIITAGHVVYNRRMFNGWAQGGRFYPRYEPGSTYSFTMKTLYTLQGWIDSNAEDTRYDMAGAVMTENFNLPELPLFWELNEEPFDYVAVGYPGVPIPGYDFNGQRMWKSEGEAVGRRNGVEVAMNNLTYGASGGPWCNPEENLRVVGITAARGQNVNEAYSPIFAEGFQNLVDALQRA